MHIRIFLYRAFKCLTPYQTMEEDELFKPRNYQLELMKISVNNNTIIYLPTGAGKTYIAVLVIKYLSAPINVSWTEGGKVTILLVNTVALAHQHADYIKRHTSFNVGVYTGELNVDFWNEQVWHEQCKKFQILVMTCQILTNAVERNLLDLHRVNLLIFDECHRGVNDQPMRQLMRHFQFLKDKPRVLGLTATLLNSNCSANEVREMVRQLEITYHSKVATVDELKDVLGYSTNPSEQIVYYTKNQLSPVEQQVIAFLHDSINILNNIYLTKEQVTPPNLVLLKPAKGQTALANLLHDTVIHIEMLGLYGGLEAIVAHTIQIECMKRFCDDEDYWSVLNYVITSLTYVKKILSRALSGNIKDDVENLSSTKVKQLLLILKEYKETSQEDLCAIIFVQRRFTAKVLYHLLKVLAENSQEYSFLKPNFIVGYNTNPFNNTRESLYFTKINKEVIQGFFTKEFNILVSSNVLEEGIDVPTCTLVVKFDEPMDYRSYVQSKGRARHKDSLYYIMVDQQNAGKFLCRYGAFQSIELELNNYLIGQNAVREGPTAKDIQRLYEDEVPPYFVAGPNSAQVNMVSAISLLSAYCNSLENDEYTDFAPTWFLQKEEGQVRVVIELPIVCPYTKEIEGCFMLNKKQAKRAAALEACKILHSIGELDNNLRPIKRSKLDEETDYLFEHWPEVKETAGGSKTARVHPILVPKSCKTRIEPRTKAYIHVIKLSPMFENLDEVTKVVLNLYSSNLCFGIISSKTFPLVCEFPLYDSSGKIQVEIVSNANAVSLSKTEIDQIRRFNYLIYNDVLHLLKKFLTINNNGGVFVVPIDKQNHNIDFSLMEAHPNLRDRFREPTREERLSMIISEETLLHRIVTPWYRKDDREYLVMDVCEDLVALSEFPQQNYSNYKIYYEQLYQCTILNESAPLIRVKALSNSANYLKPRGLKENRKHKDQYLNYRIHLVPELVVVQDFPSCLWLQAKLLPSVFDRLFQLLRVEELRRDIVCETGVGFEENDSWEPLELDDHLIEYEFESRKESEEVETHENVDVLNTENIISLTNKQNKEVVSNTLQEGYPWEKADEPVDIERNLNVTFIEIQDYMSFLIKPVSDVDRQMRNSPIRHKPAITYNIGFKPKPIRMLHIEQNIKGPELAALYKGLATAKCNDIVNLERLETLGDSFLKFIVSQFITLKYPKYGEGKATTLKGQIVSNKNLFYLAKRRSLGSYLKYYPLHPKEDWCPPGFCLPDILNTRKAEPSSVLTTTIPNAEQITGVLSEQTIRAIEKDIEEHAVTEETCTNTINYYIGCQNVSDKFVADCVESLLGVYLESCGIPGAKKMLQWLGVIPTSINLEDLLRAPLPNPLLNSNITLENIDFHIPTHQTLENNLGYTFQNRAYLLEALTHSSYTPNRYTRSYQRLEFLGDAVLDFLVTMHIYESCKNLKPGDLTDLRSAIVNNITFACFTVRCGFYKHLLAINNKLQGYIDKFVKYQENKNFAVSDDVVVLLNEDDLIAEYVDVPKVLGDMFESLAGAVFLDSGMNLNVVWDVFYKIMWKEMNQFQNNVPKNAVRMLYEVVGAHPSFHKPVKTEDGKVMVKLDFMINGSRSRVHGFGDNKTVAKRAAAKIALRLLN